MSQLSTPYRAAAPGCRPLLWAAIVATAACTFGDPSEGGPEGTAVLPAATQSVAIQSDSSGQAAPAADANTQAQEANQATAVAAPTCPAPQSASDFFGDPRCCHTKAKLCEDFEEPEPGQEPNATLWKVLKASSGVVEISRDQAARGKQSLHLHAANDNGEQAMVVNTSAFPFANNIVWGRAFVYFNSPHPNNHTSYVAAGPNPNPNYQWLRYSSFGGGMLGGNDSDPDNSSSSNQTLAMQKWSCIEWHFDPTPQVMKAYYYLDGDLISTLNIDGKHANTDDLKFGQIEIGWEIYSHDGNGDGWDLFIDEIALNDTRIGCAN